MNINRLLQHFLVVFIAIIMCSCATQNLFQSKASINRDSLKVELTNFLEHRIKKDDKITVSIWNHDDLSVGSLFGIYNSNEVYGKWVLVDDEGFVILPQIGKVKLGELTIKEAEVKLTEIYSKFIVNPVLVVKVLNKEVVVLGEVKNPGNYILDKEINTVTELLGRAGGTDFYANKKQITIIRGTGKEAKRMVIDLTKMDEYRHTALILQSGDILYVPTRHGKMLDKKLPDLIPVASLLTGLIILISFLGRTL